MAPVAGEITDGDEQRFVFPARLREGILAPGKPLDGILRVQAQVGARLLRQPPAAAFALCGDIGRDPNEKKQRSEYAADKPVTDACMVGNEVLAGADVPLNGFPINRMFRGQVRSCRKPPMLGEPITSFDSVVAISSASLAPLRRHALVTEKQVDEDRQHHADDDHRGEREDERAVLPLDADVPRPLFFQKKGYPGIFRQEDSLSRK